MHLFHNVFKGAGYSITPSHDKLSDLLYIYACIYVYYMTLDDNTYYLTAIKIIYILFRGTTPSSMW